MSTPLDQLEVEAQAEAVAHARCWLRGHLADWSEEGIEAAELVASELVTNVVLHGQGPVHLALGRRAEKVVLEVFDHSTAPPVVNHYTAGASTGRGLIVVDRVAAGWGVRTFPAGKGVWAILCDGPVLREPHPSETALVPPQRSARGELPPDWDPPAELHTAEQPRPSSPLAEETMLVRILGIPLEVYFAAQEHNDDLQREFRYLLETEPDSPIPSRLLALAAEVRMGFSGENGALRAQVEEAQRQGRSTVDLEIKVPRRGWWALSSFARLLDEVDDYCKQGKLLTLASSPALRRFRSWYLGEVLAQLDGQEPTPWPYDGAGEGGST